MELEDHERASRCRVVGGAYLGAVRVIVRFVVVAVLFVSILSVRAESWHGHVTRCHGPCGYERSSTDLRNLLLYVERAFRQLPLKPAAVRRHLARLHGMILVNLVETFERYLKEVAAACVDHLARYVLDDRFNAFRIQGSALAAHFGTDTLGRSLCESATWLDCDEVNERFRRLLSRRFESGDFFLFPSSRRPSGSGSRHYR